MTTGTEFPGLTQTQINSKEYRVRNRIITAGGRTEDCSIYIKTRSK